MLHHCHHLDEFQVVWQNFRCPLNCLWLEQWKWNKSAHKRLLLPPICGTIIKDVVQGISQKEKNSAFTLVKILTGSSMILKDPWGSCEDPVRTESLRNFPGSLRNFSEYLQDPGLRQDLVTILQKCLRILAGSCKENIFQGNFQDPVQDRILKECLRILARSCKEMILQGNDPERKWSWKEKIFQGNFQNNYHCRILQGKVPPKMFSWSKC